MIFENIASVLKVLLQKSGTTRDEIQTQTGLRIHDVNTVIYFMMQKGVLKKVRHTRGDVKNYCYYLIDPEEDSKTERK